MSLVKNYQEVILKVVNNYLKKFSIYKSDDFRQDVWLQIIEREHKIMTSYNMNAKGSVIFESYLGRAVINICKDLGTRKYAKIHQNEQKQIDIQETKNISDSNGEESKDELMQKLFTRIDVALENKSFEKSKDKIRLYMDLKKGYINKKDIKNIFINVEEKKINKTIKIMRKAKNELEIFEAISLISGKTADTERRWFNYQLQKIRNLVNPDNK